METSAESRFQVEASVSGDFHDPVDAPHTTIVEQDPGEGLIFRADEGEQVQVLDMTPGDPDPAEAPALPLSPRVRPRRGVGRKRASSRSTATTRTTRRRAARSTKKAARPGRSK